MRACPSSKAAVAWYWRNESILRLRLVAYLWRVRELAEGRLFRNERHVFPLVVTWGALCKFCWVEILSAWFWVGFSYWVRGSFKQGTISGVLVVRLLDWFDGRTYLGVLIVKALVFFVVVEDFKSMILALHSGEWEFCHWELAFSETMCGDVSTQIWLWRLVVNTDSVCLRIWGYFPGFLRSCLPALAFLEWGICLRERVWEGL